MILGFNVVALAALIILIRYRPALQAVEATPSIKVLVVDREICSLLDVEFGMVLLHQHSDRAIS